MTSRDLRIENEALFGLVPINFVFPEQNVIESEDDSSEASLMESQGSAFERRQSTDQINVVDTDNHSGIMSIVDDNRMPT